MHEPRTLQGKWLSRNVPGEPGEEEGAKMVRQGWSVKGLYGQGACLWPRHRPTGNGKRLSDIERSRASESKVLHSTPYAHPTCDLGQLTSSFYPLVSGKMAFEIKICTLQGISWVGDHLRRTLCSIPCSFSINSSHLSLNLKAFVAKMVPWLKIVLIFLHIISLRQETVYSLQKKICFVIFFLNKDLFCSTMNVQKKKTNVDNPNSLILTFWCIFSFSFPWVWYSFIRPDHWIRIIIDLHFLIYVLLLLNSITEIGNLPDSILIVFSSFQK